MLGHAQPGGESLELTEPAAKSQQLQLQGPHTPSQGPSGTEVSPAPLNAPEPEMSPPRCTSMVLQLLLLEVASDIDSLENSLCQPSLTDL